MYEKPEPGIMSRFDRAGITVDARMSHPSRRTHLIPWETVDAMRAKFGPPAETAPATLAEVVPRNPRGVRVGMKTVVNGKPYGVAVAICEPTLSEEQMMALPAIVMDRAQVELIVQMLKELLRAYGAARAGVVEEASSVQLR